MDYSRNVDYSRISCVIAGIALFLLWLIYRKVKEKRRVKAIQVIAKSLKFSFSAEDHFNIRGNHTEHKLFEMGWSSYAYNVISGVHKNYNLYSFDYVCETSGSKGRDTSFYSCVLLDVKLPLKRLFICPHRLLESVIEGIGYESIHFESADFNNKFHVRSESKKFAYDIIHTRMIEFLLQRCLHSIDFSGHSILLFKNGVRKPKEVEPMIKFLTDFVELIPEYVIEELKTGYK